MTTLPTILLVPGLRDHVEAHWQTILEKKLPNVCSVAPLEHNKLSCAARIEALDNALDRIDGPVVLLATPADLESPLPPGYPTLEEISDNGWLPLPHKTLPFPSIVAASTNDPLGNFDRISQLARDWGSSLVNLGEVGHLNPAAGFGEWPQAEALIRQLY